jgi:hypothetical protein
VVAMRLGVLGFGHGQLLGLVEGRVRKLVLL